MIQFQNDLQGSVQALIWPVIAGLVYLYVATLIAGGGIAREAWSRWRRPREIRFTLRQQMTDVLEEPAPLRELSLEAFLQRYEGRQLASINRLRMAIRLGPSLGLIGTLIPMSRALAELANGNLPALAHNMVNAFAATVLGIAVSVIAYILAATREAWMRHDDRELRIFAEILLEDPKAVSGDDDAVR